MKIVPVMLLALTISGVLVAQESKKVPKDSVRVSIPGCAKGYVFTVGPRTADQPGTSGPSDGTHLRMNASKKTMTEIQRQEGMIEIVGLMKKNDMMPAGIGIGNVRISPGASPSGSSSIPGPASTQIMIDVEGWRRIAGACPSH